jgi:hypothetical protein
VVNETGDIPAVCCEFGCGNGFYTQVPLVRRAAVAATGHFSAMLALAKERIEAANVTFQVEDCQERRFFLTRS